jgi:CPA2 family monovalent cation:H+ antiporter-2
MLAKEKIGKVFMGEHELARGMTQHILSRMRSAKKQQPH